MPELVANIRTSLTPEEVILRAIPFFTGEKWRTQSHSARIATFVGRPKIPWLLIFITIFSFLFFVIPGIIMYFFVVRKMARFQNIVVTSNPTSNGSEVVITYSKHAKKLVNKFIATLPPVYA